MENVIFTRIQKEIDANDVVLFMKGSAAFPLCGFSSQVVQILSGLGVTFRDINVLDDNDIRQGVKDFANWPTIPQLYIKGKFTGGADIIHEMYEEGELQDLLQKSGIEIAA